jgi:hypothetical protein
MRVNKIARSASTASPTSGVRSNRFAFMMRRLPAPFLLLVGTPGDSGARRVDRRNIGSYDGTPELWLTRQRVGSVE